MPSPSSRAAPAALLLFLAFAAATAGQEPELVTDRPDQTESTAIVPAGRTQIELGATFLREDDGEATVDLLQVPGTLVRIGLSERFELRLGWEGWLEEEVELGGRRARTDGFGDAEIGAKLSLREGSGLSPAIALIAATSLPVGDGEFSSDRFDPAARVSVSHDLDGGIGLGYNVGIDTVSELDPDGGGRATFASAIYTLAAGFPGGERWGFFAEIFGEEPLQAEGRPAHLLDGGATYLLRPNVQLDLTAGVGISSDASDWFAGAGISIRLPH